MSRSALWRQEGNVKERERRAEEIFQQACNEGRTRSKSTLSLWGPDNDSFHFNPLLLHNTIHSSYFQKCCTEYNDWTAIIDEIYYEVKHMQVFQLAKQPSTAFCLLLRLLCLRMTSHELDQTLRHPDSPYIRAIGFLFIRYGGCPPEQVWERIEPYIHDEEEFTIDQSGKQQNNTASGTITIGEFVRKVFQERDYYNTTPLPRFPLPIEREIQVKLLAADKIADRAKQHASNPRAMKYFQTIGSSIRALYGDDDNPTAWYDAIVDRVITRSDDGQRLLKYPKFVVTFPEYGNTETVLLGEIDYRDSTTTNTDTNSGKVASYSNTNNRSHVHGFDNDRTGNSRYNTDRRSDHHHNPRRIDEKDLYDEVRKAEQAKVATTDKGNWARRPPSTKSNLSLKGSAATSFRDDVDNDNDRRYNNQHPSHYKQNHHPAASSSSSTGGLNRSNQNDTVVNAATQASVPSNRKRTAEELAAFEEKKRKLLSKYG